MSEFQCGCGECDVLLLKDAIECTVEALIHSFHEIEQRGLYVPLLHNGCLYAHYASTFLIF